MQKIRTPEILIFLALYWVRYNQEDLIKTRTAFPRLGRTGKPDLTLLLFIPPPCPGLRLPYLQGKSRQRDQTPCSRGQPVYVGWFLLPMEAEMLTEKSTRRMPLRQLLTHSEKCSRDLVEHLRNGLIHVLTEYRELSRPVRRRSSYPTLL